MKPIVKMNSILILIILLKPVSFAGELKGKIKAGGNGLNNVIVYLEPKEETVFAPPKEAAVMDQINLTFVPHVLPVLVGTKVIFPNSDKIRHSVFSISKIKKFDFGTFPPGSEKSIICEKIGVIPVLCYIHHDMSAYIVVLKTRYFSLTNDEGDYVISGIPSGNYKLSFWNEDYEIKSEEIFIPGDGTVTKNFTTDE